MTLSELSILELKALYDFASQDAFSKVAKFRRFRLLEEIYYRLDAFEELRPPSNQELTQERADLVEQYNTSFNKDLQP